MSMISIQLAPVHPKKKLTAGTCWKRRFRIWKPSCSASMLVLLGGTYTGTGTKKQTFHAKNFCQTKCHVTPNGQFFFRKLEHARGMDVRPIYIIIYIYAYIRESPHPHPTAFIFLVTPKNAQKRRSFAWPSTDTHGVVVIQLRHARLEGRSHGGKDH